MPGLPVLKVGSGCLLYGLLLRAYSLPGYRCLLYPGMASCYIPYIRYDRRLES
jgi:hypothetical protein